jgi:hypothetical protein
MSLLRYYRLLDSGLLAPVPLGGVRTVVTGPSTTVGTQVNVDNFGFEPNCGILVSMGRVAQGADKLDYAYSIGFWAGTSDRRVCVARADAGVTTMEEHFSHREDAVNQWMNTTSTSDGLWDVHSTHSDGVRFVTDEAYPFSPSVITTSFRATQAETGSFLEGDSNMGVSFTPDIVFVIGTPTTSAPPVIDTASGSMMSYGWAHGTGTTEQYCGSGGGRDAQPNAVTAKHLSLGGEVVVFFNSAMSAVDNIGTVTSMTGGVGLSWSGSGTGRYCHYLAIKGGQWSSHDVAQPNGTTDIYSITSVPFAPEWAHGLSMRHPQGVDTTTAVDFQWAHGHASRLQGPGGSLRIAHMQVMNVHNAATANISRGWGTNFLNSLTATPSSRDTVNLNSFNSDGVTFQNGGATMDADRRFLVLLAR